MLQWIYDKFTDIERLDTPYEEDLWKILKSAKREDKDFQHFEVEVLELVFNYCHYYIHQRREHLRQFRLLKNKPEDYYRLVENWIKSGKKIRAYKIKLSEIIDEPRMASLISKLEEKKEV